MRSRVRRKRNLRKIKRFVRENASDFGTTIMLTISIFLMIGLPVVIYNLIVSF